MLLHLHAESLKMHRVCECAWPVHPEQTTDVLFALVENPEPGGLCGMNVSLTLCRDHLLLTYQALILSNKY